MNQQAAEVLKHLADKLDVPVEQLWSGLVGYAEFHFLQWEIGIIACVILLFFSLFLGMVFAVKARSEEVPWGPLALATFAVSFGAGIGIVIHVSKAGDAMAAKHAPQAWAAKKILAPVVGQR